MIKKNNCRKWIPFNLLMTLYAIIAIIAFGHSAAKPDPECPKHTPTNACKATNGIAAGVFWPLYSSWVAWEE